jgi:hypothetical protein
MSLFERFFGRPDEIDPHALVAVERAGRQISYQLLFPDRLDLEERAVEESLRAFHPELSEARVEFLTLEEDPESPSGLIGLAGWGDHVVKFFGMNFPIPQEVFDLCVRTAHFGEPLKEEARKHQSHLLLYYAGTHGDPLERYVAMTAVATALARFDAILVMNEAAHASFPAAALLLDEPAEDGMKMLRTLPIPLLYGGFVKMEVEDRPGVWMRTFGNSLLELPDLAMLVGGHHEGGETFDLFANMLAYLHDTRVRFAPGHTMQVGPETFLRLRLPDPAEEYFLDSDGEMFVVTRIPASEINR